MIHGHSCAEEEMCSFCQNLAEDRAYDWGHADDWTRAADQYDRYLDRLGGTS